MQKTFKIALLCGGPSRERGISLNSARSVLDHLADDRVEILPVYFDYQSRAYKISPAQLYSNTPSDFDFKLSRTARPLSDAGLARYLKTTDLTFIAMHGPFGEDGQIQSWLEEHDIPFVGTSAAACKQVFDKYRANEFIRRLGFFTLPSIVLKIFHDDHRRLISRFFADNKITRAIVKPATGGSSIGVFSVTTAAEALAKAELIFSKRMDTRVVVEPFAQGIEFTVIILQNRFGLPVAILPTEIEADYSKHQIFDFRKKYLPTRQVTYHCPPRFDNETIEKIQAQAEQLFQGLGMRDFARFDGWKLNNGQIWFSDINPISGLEQNSFIFQQSARVGLSHGEVLRYIVRQAGRRYGLDFPAASRNQATRRKPVNVLFGGTTAERQVSLMTGTNVWLKLKKSHKYQARPFLLGTDHKVWQLPYALTLNHTVEEIMDNCQKYAKAEARLGYLTEKVALRLDLGHESETEELAAPRPMSLPDFLAAAPYVFIGLHGGEGENGVLQKKLEAKKIKYNGPDARVSALCADKWRTKEFIKKLNIKGIAVTPDRALPLSDLTRLSQAELKTFWKESVRDLGARTMIIKPRADGCSSGIARLRSAADLQKYVRLAAAGAPHIPKNTFPDQEQDIEMPTDGVRDLLLERFVATDVVRVVNNQLKYRRVSGWIEVTVGILEENGRLHALSPSLTVAEGAVLSVEEKFQGGTGVNITPPPTELVKTAALNRTRHLIEKLAAGLNLRGYSRIDAFLESRTGDLIIIEVNTLPGLTPSTVLFHQGLAEKPPIFPRELIEKIIAASGY